MEHSLLDIIILGIVEGITEFLPVSSTGHLILAGELLGYDAERWKLFNIVIQLGAILAIVVLYWRTFWTVLRGLATRDAGSWRFTRNVLLGFIPAAVIGLALHKQIEALLGNAVVVAVALIVGGIGILAVERWAKRATVEGVAAMPARTALGIGFVQCLAMVPGVSRSGATIMGALAMGVQRRTAAEFSFFLAVPTMLGATALELFKNRAALDAGEFHAIAIGFMVAFVVALVVVKGFVAVISRYGFAPFAWYRIIAGAAALVWLLNR
ncbi:undecaprenyl-diphosphate phosphatase [Glacieibacterium sp.]|uniref:undecaprenyl-diphosphate phosphatase n=1 Tax=Glacieibacterium sp. TaxID=2860237 RepID=UPI003AFFAC57